MRNLELTFAFVASACAASVLDAAREGALRAQQVGDRAGDVLHKVCTLGYVEVETDREMGREDRARDEQDALDRVCPDFARVFEDYSDLYSKLVAAIEAGDAGEVALLSERLVELGKELAEVARAAEELGRR